MAKRRSGTSFIARGRESLYYDASLIINGLEQKKGSLKSLVFAQKMATNRKKALYALVAKTLDNKSIINAVIEQTKILQKETKLTPSLALVLIYDVLYGSDQMTVKGPLTRCILRHKNILKQAVLSVEPYETELSYDHTSLSLPRYVRVNTLKTTLEEVKKELTILGYDLKKTGQVKDEAKTYSIDELVPDLLIFPFSTKLTSSTLYSTQRIILQDKSSCLPAHILSPPPGANVIDACAAPGNKTSHLAAIMKNTGTIYAFDRDKTRCLSMKKFLTKAGATCVHCYHQDFLKVSPIDYCNVEYILVDPSCSGSGIVKRHEVHHEICSERLKSLSRFQVMILKHALSFPSVKRILYSTCSIHKEENEVVISEVLQEYKDHFRLVHILPHWQTRGLSDCPGGSYCVRVIPAIDMTQGFFVALFERK